MMLYLTGATASLNKGGVAQDDPMKSLGGYISLSPVPNGAINTLFDYISIKSMKDKQTETLAFGLINEFETPVSDLKIKIISSPENICSFKVGVVEVGEDYQMEHINNRYSEPIMVEFFDADFHRTAVNVEITQPAAVGEEIFLKPFDVTVEVSEDGYNGTWKAIEKAFSKSEMYSVKRLTETKFRIESKDDNAISQPLDCDYISSDNAEFSFDGQFRNDVDNEKFICDILEPGKAVGIWLQRVVTNVAEKDNEEMIDDYNKKLEMETIENVELAINYNIVENNEEVEE